MPGRCPTPSPTCSAPATPWRGLPGCFPPWASAYPRFRALQKRGVFEAAMERPRQRASKRRQAVLGAAGVDGPCIRAHRHAAGAPPKNAAEAGRHALGRSRGGLATKIHPRCDRRGLPLCFCLAPGNANDCTAFGGLLRGGGQRLARLGWTRRLPVLPAGKGYDSRSIRRRCRRRGLAPVIPKRRPAQGRRRPNPDFDPKAYAGRNVVERCFARLKECRRVATRHEKLASCYQAMITLACIRRVLKKAA